MLLLLVPAVVGAAPIGVRFSESTAHAFLVLKSAGGETLAHGEYVQWPKGDRIESQLTLRFTDGSLYEETLAFTQRRVFRLVSYHLVQRGPSFRELMDVSFERDGEGGHYRARSGDDTADGRLEVPEDVYNGMASMLLKNLPAGGEAAGHMLAFTPKPQLVRMTFQKEGEDRFTVGPTAHTAARYLIKLDIPGVKGVLASLMGKDPPDLQYWMTTGLAPTFLKFEGPMYLKGPRWVVELAAPRWSNEAAR